MSRSLDEEELTTRDKYTWIRNHRTDRVETKYNGYISARQLVDEHTRLAARGSYREKHLHEAVEYVLEKRGVEYISEYKVKDGAQDRHTGKGHRGRYADVYIPSTDTAIELKLKPNLRGLGQATYYAQHHNEAILLTDDENGFSQELSHAVKGVPDVHYGTIIPGVTQFPEVFDIRSTCECDLFRKAKESEPGGSCWVVKEPAL